MQFDKINSLDAHKNFLSIGCDKIGANIMSNKSNINLLYLKDIHVGAANILKQDALSIGADLAVPQGVIVAKEKYVDAILIGTNKHFNILAKKELAQPFGLKELAKQLKTFVNSKIFPTKIMGIINANDDSFYENSRFLSNDAINKIKQMIKDGANIIDIGGLSSKPGSISISPKQELLRVKPIIDEINSQQLYKKVDFSIDSYQPLVVEYALKNGFTIVNDITGLLNNDIAKLTAKYNATIVIMHMQGTPVSMQDNPQYENIILDIDNFFQNQINKAISYGIKKIILDVGIGFGKTLSNNLLLLKNIEHFKHFGYELLLGASRKSMIDKISPSITNDRLAGTLAIHLQSIKNGVSIIRCHDVFEHNQAIKTIEAIDNIS